MKAERVIETVRAEVMHFGGSDPWRLEVGATAHRLLSEAAGWVSTHTGRLLPALYGVEVHQVEGYLPANWALLSRSGSVIASGVVDGP